MTSTVEIDTFQYERLPDARNYFRLLEIISVDEAQDIKVHCKLTTWPHVGAPKYTAVSYTWGDPSLIAVILVNGKRMEVRRNCEDVLRQPCWKNGGYFWWRKSGYFWIDAICINQTDNEEKSFQVANMGEFFMDAPRTLACVGRHENDSELLFRMLHQHRTFWERCCTALYDIDDLPGQLLRIMRSESTMIKLLNALKNFLRRPYFYRVWVYQELFFGQDIRLCCEDKSVALLLLQGLYSAFLEYLRYIGLEGYMETLKSVGSRLHDGVLTNKAGYSLWQMIHVAGPLQCEDARDRVFGTLSMIDWQHKTPIQPDYSMDPFDLALDVLIRIVHDDYPYNTNSVLSNTIMVARLVGLPDQPSSRLTDEIQKRISLHFETLPMNPIVQDTGSTLSEFWGKRLHFYNGSWQIQPPPSGNDVDEPSVNTRYPPNLFDGITVQSWSEGRLWDVQNTSILLPQGVQPQDWILLPYFTEDASQKAHLAFVARDIGEREVQVVGKALVIVRLDWPTISAWERQGATFEVYIDPTDAIILAYTCNWRSRVEEFWRKDDESHKVQVDDYFQIGFCDERRYSYATR